MRPFTLACALLCLWAISPRAVAAPPKPPRYDITDLGALHTPADTTGYFPIYHHGALAINNRGQILLSIEGKDNFSHDFLWERNNLTDLSRLGPIGKSETAALNDLGQVLVNAETGEPGQSNIEMIGGGLKPVMRAYIYSAGTLIELRMPLFAAYSYGCDLNNRGEVIGECGRRYDAREMFSGRDFSRIHTGGPVFWSAWGTPFQLNDRFLSLFTELNGFSGVDFINNRGVIWGRSFIMERFRLQDGRQIKYVNYDTGIGRNVNDFNDNGQIVGQVSPRSSYNKYGIPTTIHAFLIDSRQKENPRTGAEVKDLGVLAGDDESAATALNNNGQIVGWSNSQKRAKYRKTARAFLWQNGQMYDLHSLTRHGGDWGLHNATGINERGQIIGNGLWKGQLHAFLLTPH